MNGPDEVCPNCGNTFSQIGNHWNRSSNCDYPNLTETQREIITGVLMGDGCINRGASKNPLLQVKMINEQYLQWLDDVLGVYGTGVEFNKTAEESYNEISDRDFSNATSPDNYSDVYILRTRCSPVFDEFARWYDSGKKIFDYGKIITPTTMIHWHVCDGSLNYSGSSPQLEICCSNEGSRIDRLVNEIVSEGLPEPHVSSWEGDDYTQYKIRFSGDDSDQVMAYMMDGNGFSPPGFEHKFYRKI
jgi:hypothetical protein